MYSLLKTSINNYAKHQKSGQFDKVNNIAHLNSCMLLKHISEGILALTKKRKNSTNTPLTNTFATKRSKSKNSIYVKVLAILTFNIMYKPKLNGIILIIAFLQFCVTWPQSNKKKYQTDVFSHQELKNWKTYGFGTLIGDHGQSLISEAENSLGYMLVSPKSYKGDMILSYDIMALNAATVLVVELATHNTKDFQLNFTEPYNGNVKYMFNNFNMYMFAFHNASHNKNGPFVRKWPTPGPPPLKAANKNVMRVGQYHHVELGIKKGKLFFKIDGRKIWSVKDDVPYKGGKVILRIRGNTHDKASCLIKNLKIQSSYVED